MPIENIGKKCSPLDDQAGSFSGHDLFEKLKRRGLKPIQTSEQIDTGDVKAQQRRIQQAISNINGTPLTSSSTGDRPPGPNWDEIAGE